MHPEDLHTLGLTRQWQALRLPASSLEHEHSEWQCPGPREHGVRAVGDVLAASSGHWEDLAQPSSTSLMEGAVHELPVTTHLAQEQMSIPCAA